MMMFHGSTMFRLPKCSEEIFALLNTVIAEAQHINDTNHHHGTDGTSLLFYISSSSNVVGFGCFSSMVRGSSFVSKVSQNIVNYSFP